MTKVAWFTVIRPSSHLIWVNFCCFSYFCCRLTFFVWCRFKMADLVFVWLRTLRTSPYHVVDSLHAMKFPNSAPLFSPVHWIGILDREPSMHSRAERCKGEIFCTKSSQQVQFFVLFCVWILNLKVVSRNLFCNLLLRFLLLTFFHFEPLIFVDYFFVFQIGRILLLPLPPR